MAVGARVASLLAGIVAMVAAVAWLSGMLGEKVEPGWTARGARHVAGQPTAEVHEVSKPQVEEAVGELKSASRTVVSAKLLATIEQILVAAGDQVEAGETLIRLDRREYEARLNQASQALVGARARREEAEKEFARLAKLLEKGAVSRSDYDRADRNVQVAKADEARAEQAVAESEVLMSYTTIEAASVGRVVDRLAQPGDVARPGEPLLVLYDAGTLRLEAPVMEQLAMKLKTGDTLHVYVDALEREFPATVEEIVPQADAPSRSFLVKASVPRSQDLYEGMFGRLRIPAGTRRHLCLDTRAVERIGQLEFVDVVLPDGTLERRLITTGKVGVPGQQEVLSGLRAGEQVLLQRGEDESPESTADGK
jgi:RND family efflux transporter MFP subunit